MKKETSIEYLIRMDKAGFTMSDPVISTAKEMHENEILKAKIKGLIASIVWIFFIVGVVSLFSSCNKCVTCTTVTTTTDLQDNVTGTSHDEFPLCDRQEKKYWDGRQTSESKGTYKVKTSTTCDK